MLVSITELRCPKREISTTSEAYQQIREDIRKNGMQRSIIVRPKTQGRYTIIDGATRYSVVVELGIKEIPIQVSQ